MLIPCSYLKQFSVQPRYPKELNITDENVETAIRYALEVKEFREIAALRKDDGGK